MRDFAYITGLWQAVFKPFTSHLERSVRWCGRYILGRKEHLYRRHATERASVSRPTRLVRCHGGALRPGPQGRARLTASAGRAGESSRLRAEPACWTEGCIGVGAGRHGPGVRQAVRGRPVGSPKGLPKHTPLRQEMNKGRPLEPALNCNGRAGPCAPVQRVPAPPAPGPVWHRGPGNPPKLLLSPDLCASRGLMPPPLPPPCRRVYSSPSRRTPKCGRANPENRILRKTQEVRQTI